MKNLFYLLIVIIVGVFFFPKISDSNTSGSIGGKTGSPNDGNSCTQCHYAGTDNGAAIETNIPETGYIPGELYTITATVNQNGINKFGFEITSEENNINSNKTGTFIVTNPTETKLTNNNSAITHKSSGTISSNSKSWTMNWEASNQGTGDVSFYAAFIASNNDGTNAGDTYHSTSLNINESPVSSQLNFYKKNNILYHQKLKIITNQNRSEIIVVDMNGKEVIYSKKEKIFLGKLKKGNYVIRSKNNFKKISIF